MARAVVLGITVSALMVLSASPIAFADGEPSGSGCYDFEALPYSEFPLGIYNRIDSFIQLGVVVNSRLYVLTIIPSLCMGEDPLGGVISTIQRETGSPPSDPTNGLLGQPLLP
jgi:hypothetical protein